MLVIAYAAIARHEKVTAPNIGDISIPNVLDLMLALIEQFCKFLKYKIDQSLLNIFNKTYEHQRVIGKLDSFT